MTSTVTILICSFLIIGIHTVSSKKYTADDLIDDVSPFVPGSRFVLKSALRIWKAYGKYKKFTSNSTNDLLEELGEELNEIDKNVKQALKDIRDVSKDVKDLKIIITDKVIMDGPKVTSLNDQLRDFEHSMVKLNEVYAHWKAYNQSNIKNRNERLKAFANDFLNIKDSFNPGLNEIYIQLSNGTHATTSMLTILIDKHLTNTLVCQTGESPLYKLSYLYQQAMKAFMKGMVLCQFATAQQETDNNELDNGEYSLLVDKFYRRTAEVVRSMKIFMLHASQAYWKCDAMDLHEGVTYAKLDPIFQTYFLKEEDAHDGIHGCGGTCADRKDIFISDKCESKFCKRQTECLGIVTGCGPSKDQMEICLADPSSGRRYHYIKTKGKDGLEIFGKINKCRDTVDANTKNSVFGSPCEYCQCTCLSDYNRPSENRFFSLRNVTSDAHNNKVITGVRFAKENHIFHIQIEEGVLLENGIIDKDSTSWKAIDNFTYWDDVREGVDYHMIEWEKRTVHLDDLVSKEDTVLTGIRFKVVDQKALQLEIQVTPFDFETGKLDPSKSTWITNPNDKDRAEIDMSERSLPQSNDYKYLASEHNQFLKFTTSSFKHDLGQTVVPFIDFSEITTTIRTPLSGAGLIHQANNPGSAGFLSFKLFNYNYAHHLEN